MDLRYLTAIGRGPLPNLLPWDFEGATPTTKMSVSEVGASSSSTQQPIVSLRALQSISASYTLILTTLLKLLLRN